VASNQIPFRPWQVIAQELSTETDPVRISELAAELNCALSEQTAHLNPSARPTYKP
jgi:hypothetical protein